MKCVHLADAQPDERSALRQVGVGLKEETLEGEMQFENRRTPLSRSPA